MTNGPADPFSPEVSAAVAAHMNGDHDADSLVIVRANGEPGATTARMVDVTDTHGVWQASTPDGEVRVEVPWATPLVDRASVRREVVAVYEDAVARMARE